MSTVTGAMDAPAYPLRYDVEYPEELNRWLVLVKWLLAIPHLLIVSALVTVAYIITVIAFFAILFTTRYPRELFDFVVNIFRWNANATAYFDFLRDEYPPFSWEPGQYPVTYEVDYPEQLNRWLPLVKWLLAVPHFIVLWALGIAAIVVWFIAFFAILFTASYPRGLFDFFVGVTRWNNRVTAYVLLMRDEYPPFSLKQEAGIDPQPDRRWYASGWVMIASGYVFPPLGLYLMWRYKDWPASLKVAVTMVGLTLACVSTYVSSTYVMPHVF